MSTAPPLPPGRQRRSTTAQQAIENADRAIPPATRVGRRKTYSTALCKRALALGAVGHSWAGIARDFGISRATLNEWERQFPEFSDALARARAAAQSWWEDKTRTNLESKHFQAQGAKLIMSAQFDDYREVAKGSQPNGLDLSELVGAISQGITAATLQHQDGDRAKVIDGQPVEDDAQKQRKD